MNTYRLGSVCCTAVFGLGVIAAAVHDSPVTADPGAPVDGAVVEAAAPLPTSPATIASYPAPSTTSAAEEVDGRDTLHTPAGGTPLVDEGDLAAQSTPGTVFPTPNTTAPSTPLVTLPSLPIAVDDLLARLPTTELDRVRQLVDGLSTAQTDAFAAQVRGLTPAQVADLVSVVTHRSSAGDLTGVVQILLAADVARMLSPAPDTTLPTTTRPPTTTGPPTATTVPTIVGIAPTVPTMPSPATNLAPILDDALNGLLGG